MRRRAGPRCARLLARCNEVQADSICRESGDIINSKLQKFWSVLSWQTWAMIPTASRNLTTLSWDKETRQCYNVPVKDDPNDLVQKAWCCRCCRQITSTCCLARQRPECNHLSLPSTLPVGNSKVSRMRMQQMPLPLESQLWRVYQKLVNPCVASNPGKARTHCLNPYHKGLFQCFNPIRTKHQMLAVSLSDYIWFI